MDLQKIERFLRICILLLGKNKLLRMLAELKVEVIEGRGPHNPTGPLIWRLLTEISQPVRANPTPSPADQKSRFLASTNWTRSRS